jgi:UDP-N-acetylmuramate--alanine ligase
VTNALAAAAAGKALGIGNGAVGEGLSAAMGVKRRFEHKGEWRGANVIDDYAHHPTEIKANLEAARQYLPEESKIVCVFQPHTYTRTLDLLFEFTESFYDADSVILLPIYASRETDDGSVSSGDLYGELRAIGVDAYIINTFDEAVIKIKEIINPGDMLITMGAGDVHKVGETLIKSE